MQKILCKEDLMTPDESLELSEKTWGIKRFKE